LPEIDFLRCGSRRQSAFYCVVGCALIDCHQGRGNVGAGELVLLRAARVKQFETPSMGVY
jgi:hypothetical protein